MSSGGWTRSSTSHGRSGGRRGFARIFPRKPPRLVLPTAALRALAPFGPLVGRLAGIPPNLRELISASDDVTYWASDAKARRELGYSSRSLSDGLRLTV